MLDFCLDLRMEFANPLGHLGSIPGAMTLHEPSRPNTASCETHLPASTCFRDRLSDRNDLESLRISIVSMSPSNWSILNKTAVGTPPRVMATTCAVA